jgi:cytochrome oxidase assembly protein ShyY1
VLTVEAPVMWADMNRFLVDRGYIREENLRHLKADSTSLINLYRIHACNFITLQIVAIAAKSKIKIKSKPRIEGNVQGDVEEESEEDYTDEDFTGLKSQK